MKNRITKIAASVSITVSFKDLFDVSAVLLQNALETTSPFTDARLAAAHGCRWISNNHSILLLFEQTVNGFCLPVFR